jgi:peptidoglycan hydrolase CwlO-like protein
MTNETCEKDKIIKDLEAEDKRLCNVISNLYSEIGKYNKKIEKQEQIIHTQQDIINNLTELIELIL